MNDFQQSFARMGKSSFFKENFRANGMTYEATAIDEIDATTRLALGGELADATTTIYVSLDTMKESNVSKSTPIYARNLQLRILKIGQNGASGFILYCGSPENANL